MWKSFSITLGATMAVAIPVMKLLKVDEIAFWVCVAGLGSVFPLMGIMIGQNRTSAHHRSRSTSSTNPGRSCA